MLVLFRCLIYVVLTVLVHLLLSSVLYLGNVISLNFNSLYLLSLFLYSTLCYL
jgi:hypothetical protein